MRKILLILISITLFINLSSASTGSSGLTYLTLPPSGRSAASMEVLTSQSNSPLAIFSSPLGTKSKTPQLSFSHNIWFSDIHSEALALGYPTQYGDFGIGLNLVQIPGFEVRDKPMVDPQGETDVQYFSGNLSYTKKVLPQIRMGATFKYLFEHLYTETATGFAVDLGILWEAPADLNLSASLKNYGKMNELYQESTTLPQTLVIGVVRPELLNEGPLSASLGVNVKSNLVTNETGSQIGGELAVKQRLFLRAGYEKYGEVDKKSFGVGLKYKNFILDYGILLMDNNLANPKLITLNYCF